MSAEPMHAPVAYLEPVPSPPRPAQATNDEALTELALALDTQRSANRAMIQAVKGMDGMLGEQRELNAELTHRNEHLEAQIAEYAEAVTRQVADNKRLWCEVRLAEHRLEEWLDKPAWRRLMRR
jgi:hypothetical protein